MLSLAPFSRGKNFISLQINVEMNEEKGSLRRKISQPYYICLNVRFWMRPNINLKDSHIRIGKIILHRTQYILHTI